LKNVKLIDQREKLNKKRHLSRGDAEMEQTRLVEIDSGTFFGKYLYDQVVPQGHFLRILRTIVDWEYFTNRLIKLYKGQGVVGRPPFDPPMVPKVEVIAYLYKLSERQVEVFMNEILPFS
jgi:hypothetical protein